MSGMETDSDNTPQQEPPEARTSELLNILDLHFHNSTLNEAADELIALAGAADARQIFFVNAHCVNVAAENPEYAAVLTRADRLYADGAGMALAASLNGESLKDNINGTDLFPLLCARAAAARVPVALLGARPGRAKLCAEMMRREYPDLRIVYAQHGYYEREREAEIVREIGQSGARILLVAMGVPAQELWIARHAPALQVPVIMGVGALFDFYSGIMPRSPLLLRRLRLEWLFRFCLEPRRLFRRYIIGNPVFLLRLLKYHLSS
jgi:N-acetylglucosaminyldiphosphoundecaprenol N-acetyl-beta-D-mannosaminyltransferase